MGLAALSYEYVDDVVERRRPLRERHLELIAAYRERGALHLAGAVGDPPRGAWFVFAGAEEAERFVAEDPYVAGELVVGHRVEPINVVALEPPRAG